MTTEIFADAFKTEPYWWEAAPPEAFPDPLPETVDVAIVGGGYCGTVCALELARAGTQVAVLEAGVYGLGASTRNGGLVSGTTGLTKADPIRRFGPERGGAMVEEGGQSFDHLEALIARESLDAGYRRTGRFVGAHAPAAFRRLQATAAQMHAAGAAVRVVSRAEQHSEIGSDHFHGGLAVETAGSIHPGLYHRSLRAAARRHGARMFSHAPVGAITPDDTGFTVATDRGTVRAKTVVVATNGYSGPVMPWLQRRLIPVASYIIATEPLPAALTARLSPKNRAFADTRKMLSYFRLSPDGTRVLFGGRARLSTVAPREAAPMLRQMMLRVWPELERYRLTHAWTGNVAFTFDLVPHMGVQDGVHYAAGCQGSGVAMATWLGHRTAQKLLGRENRPSAFDGLPMPTRPLYRGRPWFLPTVGAWYRFRDWWDGRAA